MRIEESKPLPGREVLSDEIAEKGALAGARLPDDVEGRRRSSWSSTTSSPNVWAPMQSCWPGVFMGGREPVCRAHRDSEDGAGSTLIPFEGAPGLHGVASLCVMT